MAEFRYECERAWSALEVTAQPGVRWCHGCSQRVWMATSVAEGVAHASLGRCVAVPSLLVASRKRRDTPRTPVQAPEPQGTSKTVRLGSGFGDEEGLPVVGWLVPLDGPRSGETILLDADVTALGGETPADIVLPDASIETPHARIRAGQSGYSIEDAGSQAGTYVNDQRLERAWDLADNDVIRLGATRLHFKAIV